MRLLVRCSWWGNSGCGATKSIGGVLRILCISFLVYGACFLLEQVTDPDNTQRVVQRPSCTLASGGDNAYFKISGESPNMDLETTTTTVLDYEVKRTYHISVTCNDHGLPPKMITRSFTIGVSGEMNTSVLFTVSLLSMSVPATIQLLLCAQLAACLASFRSKHTQLPCGILQDF